MSPSSSKKTITLTKWNAYVSNKSKTMKKLLGRKERLEEKKKRLFNFKESNLFQKRFFLKFLKRVFMKKLGTK